MKNNDLYLNVQRNLTAKALAKWETLNNEQREQVKAKRREGFKLYEAIVFGANNGCLY